MRSKFLIGIICLYSSIVLADGVNNGSTPTGLAPIATSGSASNLTSGTVPAAQMPALSGDVTSSLGSTSTTVVKINGEVPSSVATSGSASDLSAGTLSSARLPSGLTQVIGSLRGANFNTTADQAIAIRSGISVFQITGIAVTNCSTSLTLAAGGFYPTTGKGGTPIIAAVQAYSSLTGASVLLSPTIAATPLVTRYSISNIYLSLTTAQGSAATCDVYVIGNDLT